MQVPTKISADLLVYRKKIIKQSSQYYSKTGCMEKIVSSETEKLLSKIIETDSEEKELTQIKWSSEKMTRLNPERQMPVCKFFLSNSCLKGENCSFLHDLRRVPCRAYHIRKNCHRRICTFSHNPVSIAVYNKMKEDDLKERKSFISPFH